MPIQHTVVFALVHEAGSAAEADFLDTGRTTLTSIPGVTEFQVNRQVSPKSDLGWQFTRVFADRAAYDAKAAELAAMFRESFATKFADAGEEIAGAGPVG